MKLTIFSGTSEGHALCRFVSACGGNADVYVATDYGAAVMEPMPGITVHEGRLDADAMAAVLDADTLLVDATHPYAAVVSDNLRAACTQTGAQYERLLRPQLDSKGVVTVPDTAAAVRWLNAHPGRALLTVGSKELLVYTGVRGWRERLVARVLPSVSVLEQCASFGFAGAQVIAMQGPFSHELNTAMLRQTGADILVTKDTGKAGGFAEKLSAAREVGATVLVIARPCEEQGKTLSEMQDFLAVRFGWTQPAPVQEQQTPRFPFFVSLAGKKCVVFGAGKIAARRVEVLRHFGATVTVVAPDSPAGIVVDHVRGYEKSDLSGVFLAVAATNDRKVNHRIALDCEEMHIPCSVADCAAESIFFFPAICEGGGLIAGVVSDGTAHGKTAAAAKCIRAVLEEMT